MRVMIRQKNLELTLPLRTYIEQKVVLPVQKLLKRAQVSELPILDMEVERTTRHHRKGQVYRVLANLAIGRKLIRAEATDEDVRAACDLLEEELKREVQTHKTKSVALEKRGARVAKKELHLARSARLFRKGRIRDEGN